MSLDKNRTDLVDERVDTLRGDRLCELQQQEDPDLQFWEGRHGLGLLRGQERCGLVKSLILVASHPQH